MEKPHKSTDSKNLLEQRFVGVFLNAILFICNFLLFYFVWLYAFPDITGLLRVALCWVGAYVMTWIMSFLAKGVARLVLVAAFLGILYVVFTNKP